jgi:hypothetical protein
MSEIVQVVEDGFINSGRTMIRVHVYPQAPVCGGAICRILRLFFIIQNGIRLRAIPAWADHGTENS